MAYNLLRSQSNLSAVTNEMIFVVTETVKAVDPVTYPDYKYIADIYTNGTFRARLRAFPDPTYSYGVFDVSKILQSFVPDYGFDISNDIVDYDIVLTYQIKFGEEYDGTLYTNVLTDSSRTCVKTYESDPYTDTLILPTAGIASSMPTTRTAFQNPDHPSNNIEYFVVPYYSNATGISDLTVTYKDKNGNTLNTATYDNSNYNSYQIRQYNVLNSLEGTAQMIFTGNINLTVNVGCTKHPVIYLIWLNKFGGYESQQFAMVSKKKHEIERKSFQKTKYVLNASGDLTYISNGVMNNGKRTFASNTKQSWEVSSHILSDDEYEWLAELLSSTDVYVYKYGMVGIVPVTIIGNNYEQRTYLNSQMERRLELELEFSNPYNAQFL